MLRKIEKTIERFSMLKKHNKVLLCVSGGPDSVAMLYAFLHIAKKMRLKLFIAHFNHCLRKNQSDGDQRYVEKLTNHFKIPLFAQKEDTKKFAKTNRLSLEDAARRLRYDFFIRRAEGLGIDSIVTAHTKDDQAETVLMRILRGSGLRGLRGIVPKSSLSGYAIIRPLIDVERKEVIQYLKKNKIRPRIDSSNKDKKFFRNKIRLELLPYLKKNYNPKIKDLLVGISEAIGSDYEYLTLKHKSIYRKMTRINREEVKISLSDFRKSHVSLKRALTRNAIEDLKGDLDNIDFRHWSEVEDLVNKRPIGSIVDLPGMISVKKSASLLRFYSRAKKKAPEKKEASVIVNVPGDTAFGKNILKTTITKRYRNLNSDLKNIEQIDFDKVSFPLTLRTRRPGDRFMPLGMKRYKKMSDFFIDEKIPLKRRERTPLLLSATGEIIWVLKVRISEMVKATDKTKKVLKLKFT